MATLALQAGGVVYYRVADKSDSADINYIRKEIDNDKNSPQGAPPICAEDIIETCRSISFVAQRDDLVLGYISLCAKDHVSFENCISVEFKVYVLPKEQGKKIGTQLINLVENYAACSTGAEYIELGVSNKNERAKKLYLDLGYESLGKGQTGETMRKRIQR